MKRTRQTAYGSAFLQERPTDRISCPVTEADADGFVELTDEEAQQMGFPF